MPGSDEVAAGDAWHVSFASLGQQVQTSEFRHRALPCGATSKAFLYMYVYIYIHIYIYIYISLSLSLALCLGSWLKRQVAADLARLHGQACIQSRLLKFHRAEEVFAGQPSGAVPETQHNMNGKTRYDCYLHTVLLLVRAP